MKVNEIHDHAVYEKIKVLHYFRFAAEGLMFGINVIHVMNFSNVQNVFRISVMYVMSRARIIYSLYDGWVLASV